MLGAERTAAATLCETDGVMPARARGGVRRLVSLAAVARKRAPALLSQLRADAFLRPSPFRRLPVDVASWNLFDLGVVTAADGGQHLFTSNHNSRQSLLAVDGQGGFEDRLTTLRLNQDSAFPGWEDDVRAPVSSDPGVYLFRQGNSVVVRCIPLPGGAALGGTLEFLSPVTVQHRSAMELQVSDDERTGAPGGVVVRFSSTAEGRVHLAPRLVGLPFGVTVDDGVPLTHVYVGSTMTRPASRRFSLHARDRHGMAWADWNGDGRPGVFVARGGLRGLLEEHPGIVSDELLAHGENGFDDFIASSGIDKGGCRSRQAAWVALDHGGRLDLFVSCLRSHPQLYRQEEPGRFIDVTTDLGLDRVGGDCFSWMDVDDDGRPELLAAEGDHLVVYARPPAGPFARREEIPLRNGTVPVKKLVVGDYDGDGRPDIFAPSPGGSTLVVNGRAGFRPVDPASVGLPSSGGVTANWVDYDNDGLLDLHVVPGGLFRQTSPGRFTRTGLLERELPATVTDARVSWFDSSGNGARDVVIAVVPESKGDGKGFQWDIGLFRNCSPARHWLHVVLEGPEGNRQAVGASVRVQVGGRTLTQWVGCNEGSHFSQGHYRLYFGLGEHGVASSVEVRWPDGSVQQLGRPAGDEVLRMSYAPDQEHRPS